MKTKHKIIVGAVYLALVAGFSGAAQLTKIKPGIYPNPKLTPGAADTLNVGDLLARYDGKTYSEAHRNVSEATKRKVYQEYGLSYPQGKGEYEVDHFWPLCAGGSNDLKNLWLEPADVKNSKSENWGFHQKDVLEAAICRMVVNKEIGSDQLKKIFEAFITDWVGLYKHMDKQMLGLEYRAGSAFKNEPVE